MYMYIFYLKIALVCSPPTATIMCSTCRSDKMAECESSPPAPQPCTESGSGVVKSCSTIRIHKINTSKSYVQAKLMGWNVWLLDCLVLS